MSGDDLSEHAKSVRVRVHTPTCGHSYPYVRELRVVRGERDVFAFAFAFAFIGSV